MTVFGYQTQRHYDIFFKLRGIIFPSNLNVEPYPDSLATMVSFGQMVSAGDLHSHIHFVPPIPCAMERSVHDSALTLTFESF